MYYLEILAKENTEENIGRPSQDCCEGAVRNILDRDILPALSLIYYENQSSFSLCQGAVEESVGP